MTEQTVIRAEFFHEGDLYVGLAPELDVSSFGGTLEEARESLREAANAFLDECREMGTLEAVLEEASFGRRNDTWVPRQPVAAELLTAS